MSPSLHLVWCLHLLSPATVSYSKQHRFLFTSLTHQAVFLRALAKSSCVDLQTYPLAVTEDNAARFPTVLIINEAEHKSSSSEVAQRRKE